MTHENDAKDIFHLRRACGLPQIVRKRRTCLCCGSLFDSEGSHNRICADCRYAQQVYGHSLNLLESLGQSGLSNFTRDL